ncbi:MAG: hypothetical protein IKE76_04560 [Clostridia bacterium]|nr:hypothetical protein [Clostridia bacterium]
MQNSLFREKSLERIASPEQLNDYMRVTSPAMWMVLGAVIALLAGLLALSCATNLETLLPAEAVVEDGMMEIRLPASKEDEVDDGMTVRVAGQEVTIDYVRQDETGEVVCTADIDAEDGTYDADIVTESISPISFLLNS